MIKKSQGREKAKENSFIRKGARPEEYSPNVTKICRKTQNCDLCGQHISYDFLLEHPNPERNMYVGSDCIVTFCQTYLPNLALTMLRHMEMKMEEMIEEAKAVDFQERLPTFLADRERLAKGISELLSKYNVRNDLYWGKRKLPIFETIADAGKDYNKKKYTTKPKVEEIQKALRDLDSGDFEALIKEYADNRNSVVTIADDIKKAKVNQEFYDLYFKNTEYIRWDKKSPGLDGKALSKIEKEIFLNTLEEFLNKRSRLKKKLTKNKKQIFDGVMIKMLGKLKTIQIDMSGWPFSDASGVEKDKISAYKFALDIQPIYNMYSIRDDLIEYGIKPVAELQGKKIDSYTEMMKDVDFYPYRSFMALFKTEEDLMMFVKKLEDHFAGKLDEIDEYLKSDELVNEKFN